MVAAAGEAGKTLRLRLAAVVAGVVTLQAHRQPAHLAVQVVSQRWAGRGSTFRALTALQAQVPTISGTTAAAQVAGPPMLRLPILAAGRYMVAAAGGLAVERVLFRQ
jgi:hypothetical protein